MNQPEADEYLTIVRTKFRTVVLAVLVGLFVGLVVTFIPRPIYEARTLLITPIEDPLHPSPLAGGGTTLQVLKGIALSQRTQLKVARRLGIKEREAEGMMVAMVQPARNQLILSGFHEKPDMAEAIVHEMVGQLEWARKEIGAGVPGMITADLDRMIAEHKLERDSYLAELEAIQRTAMNVSDPEDPQQVTQYAALRDEARIALGSVDQQISSQRSLTPSASSAIALVNPSVAGRQRLIAAEVALSQAKATLAPGNPAYQRALAEFESAKRGIEREVIAALNAQELGLEEPLISLLAEKKALEWQVEWWTKLANRAPSDTVEILSVNAKVKTSSKLIESLRSYRSSVALGKTIDQLRWTVVEPESVLPRPVNKDYFRNGLIGVIFGLFAGMTFAIWRTSR